jgi:drug/metabolite transporter (DMT)-like permease
MTSAPTAFGLCSASSWGGSDFLGGLGARRAPALLVTAAGQFISLAILVGIFWVEHLAIPGRHDLLITLIGGFEGALALSIFYQALAMGAMGLTAALTGLLTALVPVAFSALHYGLPTPLTAAGLACGCVAIWLITHQKGPAAPARALLLGATAGIGFGAQLILFRMASASNVMAVMTVARVGGLSALILVLLVARPAIGGAPFWLVGAASGLLDTAGNLFYLGATRLGRLDAAAVVCSLYPAVTILLAAIFLNERPRRRQLVGMALALVAVALLSL